MSRFYSMSRIDVNRGAALFVALMLLIVLTLIGLSGMEATKLETKMAANLKEYNDAFQAAEIGLANIVSNVQGNITMDDYQEIRGALSKADDGTCVRDSQPRLQTVTVEGKKYEITVTIVAADGEYGAYGTSSAIGCSVGVCELAYFIVTSTARSGKHLGSAEVTLSKGIGLPIPSPGNLNLGQC